MPARAVGVALLFCVFAYPAFAQGGRAEINGVVVDQAGGVLPGATITAIDESTSLSRTSVTNANGRYVISSLVPGRFSIKAELAGFQTQTRTGLVVGVGQELTVNLTLLLGGMVEDIVVTADTPLIETTSSRVGVTLSNDTIDSLPSAGRQQMGLLQMVPGLTPTLRPGRFEGTQFNANGRETGSNLFMVDGVYNNDDRMGASAGTQARVTLDAMEEFQVLTHQYGTEYGGSSGVIVNAITKRGSNAFHGRAFTFYQDDSLNATDYFLERAGLKNSEYGSKTFGGNIGGPIRRNKAFFFFNVERKHRGRRGEPEFPG